MRLGLIICLLAAASRAEAKPLELKTGTTGAGWKYWELTPNFDEAELKIAMGDTGKMLDELVPKGAVAALNGGYFLKNYKPTGWAKDKAKTYGKANKKSTKGGIVAVKGKKLFIGRLADAPFDPEFVIQNSPLLVDPGAKVSIKSSDGRKAPRTVACVANSTLRFILIAAQTAEGPTLLETAELLAKPVKDGGFGCDAALNLDGGPSTGAWFSDELKEKSPLPPVPIGYGIVITRKG